MRCSHNDETHDTYCCQYYSASSCLETCPSDCILDEEYNCNCTSGNTEVGQLPLTVHKGGMGRQTFVPGNGLVLGALNSQSLGPGSMLGTEICLFILPASPELSEISIYPSAGAVLQY